MYMKETEGRELLEEKQGVWEQSQGNRSSFERTAGSIAQVVFSP
jgi:hypothetical protein